MRLTRVLAAISTTGLLVLTGCGGDPQSAPTGTVSAITTDGPTTQGLSSPSPTTTTPSATATPTPVSTTATPTPTPTATAAPTTVTATTTAAASPTTRQPTASPRADPWPKALGEPSQGDPVWAVYLALAHSSDDPALDKAVQAGARVGYTAIKGDLACDQGAMEALKVDPYDFWSAVALYFDTQEKARTFIRSYRASGGTVVGSARVALGCLD